MSNTQALDKAAQRYVQRSLCAQAAQNVLKTEQDAEALRAATSAMCCVLQDLARRASELGSSLLAGPPARSASLRVDPCAWVPSAPLPVDFIPCSLALCMGV